MRNVTTRVLPVPAARTEGAGKAYSRLSAENESVVHGGAGKERAEGSRKELGSRGYGVPSRHEPFSIMPLGRRAHKRRNSLGLTHFPAGGLYCLLAFRSPDLAVRNGGFAEGGAHRGSRSPSSPISTPRPLPMASKSEAERRHELKRTNWPTGWDISSLGPSKTPRRSWPRWSASSSSSASSPTGKTSPAERSLTAWNEYFDAVEKRSGRRSGPGEGGGQRQRHRAGPRWPKSSWPTSP